MTSTTPTIATADKIKQRRKAEKENQRMVKQYSSHASAYYDKKQYDEAKTQFLAGLKITGQHHASGIWFASGLGDLFIELKDYYRAHAWFTACLDYVSPLERPDSVPYCIARLQQLNIAMHNPENNITDLKAKLKPIMMIRAMSIFEELEMEEPIERALHRILPAVVIAKTSAGSSETNECKCDENLD